MHTDRLALAVQIRTRSSCQLIAWIVTTAIRPPTRAVCGCRQLFAALDRCEETLGKQRYLTGDTLTEADVRLFQTLIRFDVVYVVRIMSPERDTPPGVPPLQHMPEASREGTCVHTLPADSPGAGSLSSTCLQT